MTKQFKPSKTFLQKVAAKGVYSKFTYRQRTGGQYSFVGGEKTYKAHLAAGYVNHAPLADLGRRGLVTLTEKGRAALGAHE